MIWCHLIELKRLTATTLTEIEIVPLILSRRPHCQKKHNEINYADHRSKRISALQFEIRIKCLWPTDQSQWHRFWRRKRDAKINTSQRNSSSTSDTFLPTTNQRWSVLINNRFFWYKRNLIFFRFDFILREWSDICNAIDCRFDHRTLKTDRFALSKVSMWASDARWCHRNWLIDATTPNTIDDDKR